MIEKLKKEEIELERKKRMKAVKDLYCMGIKTKLAKGPNPLSMRKKAIRE